jgi:DNA-binding GntR family transcriptional regulator
MTDLLEHRTMPAALASALRERIINGDLPAGTKIDQRAVAAEFQVSRMPVREALHQLDAEGFVTLLPHRGAVVSELSPSQIEEIYEMRSVLEGLASALSVKRLVDADLDRLRELLSALCRAEDVREWAEFNAEFHNILASRCNRPRLLEQIQLLRRQCTPYVRLYVRHLHQDVQADREHSEILEAAQARDPYRIEQLVRQHLMNTGRGVARYLERDRTVVAGTTLQGG